MARTETATAAWTDEADGDRAETETDARKMKKLEGKEKGKKKKVMGDWFGFGEEEKRNSGVKRKGCTDRMASSRKWVSFLLLLHFFFL